MWSLRSKGSVVVNYVVRVTSAPLPGSIHKANEQVIQNLNHTYKMDYNSFQGTPSSKWNLLHYHTPRGLFIWGRHDVMVLLKHRKSTPEILVYICVYCCTI